jgi:hypothetical protein
MLFGLTTASDPMRAARRRGRWRSSPATVTRQGSRLANSGPGGGYWPITVGYSIACYTDLRGEEHSLEVDKQPAGTVVQILYDPRHPARACVDAEFSPGALLCYAAVAVIAGLVLYLVPIP